MVEHRREVEAASPAVSSHDPVDERPVEEHRWRPGLVFCAAAAALLLVVLVFVTVAILTSGNGGLGAHFYSCRSDLKLGRVAESGHKGLAVDDDTFLRCPGRIPAVWPNANVPISSLRLFKAWDSRWPESQRRATWEAVASLARNSGMKVLVGTQISCSEEADDADWANVMTLLRMLGPERVMGVAIGNELELLQWKDKTMVPGECVDRIWGGYLLRKIEERARDLDGLAGFERVPLTSAFGGAILAAEPFWNVPQARVLDLFKSVIKMFGSRWVYSLNIYPYFDPSNHMDAGSADSCSEALGRSLCWDDPGGCLFPAVVRVMRARMRMVSGENDVLWVTETGWSSPMSDTLKGNPIGRCRDFSSGDSMWRFYSGFLSWDLKVVGSQGPDHVFYFTARDSDNFGHPEHFGLVADCGETRCKLQPSAVASPTRPPVLPRPVPVPAPVAPPPPPPGLGPPRERAECSAHRRCRGLKGNCCPTDDGVRLGCCPEAACGAHPACRGMWGDCCPTADGQILWCCAA